MCRIRSLLALIGAVLFFTIPLLAATENIIATGIGTVGNAWTLEAGSTKVDAIDDPVGAPDDDTSYISSNTGAQNQWFTFAAPSISASAVASVQMTFRCREVVAADVQARIRVNGTNYSVTATPISAATYTTQSATAWNTNPNTTLAWTEGDIEGTSASPLQEFGIQAVNVGVGDEVYCTQVYLTVTYTAASGGGSKNLLLMGVGN